MPGVWFAKHRAIYHFLDFPNNSTFKMGIPGAQRTQLPILIKLVAGPGRELESRLSRP